MTYMLHEFATYFLLLLQNLSSKNSSETFKKNGREGLATTVVFLLLRGSSKEKQKLLKDGAWTESAPSGMGILPLPAMPCGHRWPGQVSYRSSFSGIWKFGPSFRPLELPRRGGSLVARKSIRNVKGDRLFSQHERQLSLPFCRAYHLTLMDTVI